MAVDLAAIRKRVQELQNGRRNSNIQLWKPKEPGEYLIRGLPWPEKFVEAGQPFVEKYFYYIGKSFGLLAPHQFGKPDPIKEFINSLYASGKPEDREIAKKLKPKMQAYLPVVVKKGKDADPEKVLVFSINKFLYQKMLSWFLDEDVQDYLDPNTGIDIKVTLTDEGKKFNGKTVLKQDIELARKSTKLADSQEVMKKLLDSIPNIDDMFELKSPAELEATLNKWLEGGTDDEDDSRGNSDTDALDDLANEVKGDAALTKTDVVQEEKPAKTAKAKKKKDDDDAVVEDGVKKQSLDEAFEELMADD